MTVDGGGLRCPHCGRFNPPTLTQPSGERTYGPHMRLHPTTLRPVPCAIAAMRVRVGEACRHLIASPMCRAGQPAPPEEEEI